MTKELMCDEEALYDLAQLYKVFGDSTRIKILCVLLKEEMRVLDIADSLKMSISAISHQLRVLKQAHLVKYRKKGRTMIYSISDADIKTIINYGIKHITK